MQQRWGSGGDDTKICSMVGMQIYELRELWKNFGDGVSTYK